jgi:hypothetical protein
VSPLRVGAFALGCGCLAFKGCPVDDRSLDTSGGGSSSAAGMPAAGRSGSSSGGSGGGGQSPPADGGSGDVPNEGGAPPAQGGSSAQAGTSNTAGSAVGQAGSPDPGEVGCQDLDGDGVRDCEQTIAENARFMTDVAAWEPEPTLEQTWDQRDSQSEKASGALRVRNTNVAPGPGTMLSGSRQCVPAVGGAGYSVAASTLIPSGQGEGSAGIAVWFFGSDGCAANSIGNITLQLLSETDVWSVAHGTFQAPGGTRSMHVRLVTAKPFAQPSLEALFDDILVRQQ